MAIEIGDGFSIVAPRAVDLRSGKLASSRSVPYATIAEALAAIPTAYRFEGLYFQVKTSGVILDYRFNADYLTDGVDAMLSVEEAATFADISAATERRFVHVVEDETNDGEATLYYHNGTALNWVVMQEI